MNVRTADLGLQDDAVTCMNGRFGKQHRNNDHLGERQVRAASGDLLDESSKHAAASAEVAFDSDWPKGGMATVRASAPKSSVSIEDHLARQAAVLVDELLFFAPRECRSRKQQRDEAV